MLTAINTDVAESAMGLGASLRDRATLPSPLRGLVPCMGLFPSRSLLAHGLDVLLAVELELGRER